MKILAVDDEVLQLRMLQEAIGEAVPECDLHCFENSVEALAWARQSPPDVAFLDIQMPLMNGIMLGKELKKKNPEINLVFVTSYYQNYAVEAFQLRSSGYLQKPASAEAVAVEMANLRYPISHETKQARLHVQCFDRFEVFVDGTPLNFDRGRTKEILAYLIDKKGAEVSGNEICAAIYPENGNMDVNNKSDLRKCVADLRNKLREIGAADVLVKGFNRYAIVPSLIDCDYYDWEKGEPYAIRAFHGKYMSQYEWAEETLMDILMPEYYS